MTGEREDLDLSVYLVTDRGIAERAGHDLVDVVAAAVRGGVTVVQVREKDAPAGDFLDVVRRLAAVLPADVALIVNDRIDVFLAARAAGARVAGVHVGQSDLPVDLVRSLVGPDAIVGLSAATDGELRRAAAVPGTVDYVGVGALHATTTKDDAPTPLGAAEFARLVSVSALPAVAIGGVTADDLPAIRAAGGAGAAVVSAVCGAADPEAAARRLRSAWEVGA